MQRMISVNQFVHFQIENIQSKIFEKKKLILLLWNAQKAREINQQLFENFGKHYFFGILFFYFLHFVYEFFLFTRAFLFWSTEFVLLGTCHLWLCDRIIIIKMNEETIQSTPTMDVPPPILLLCRSCPFRLPHCSTVSWSN